MSFCRLKHIGGELVGRRGELEQLSKEAQELSSWSGNSFVLVEVQEVDKLVCMLESDCKEMRESLESEIEEHCAYHQSLQETEKWLLQISFQLMAHNSLYITNREQTQEQIEQHNALLSEITG